MTGLDGWSTAVQEQLSPGSGPPSDSRPAPTPGSTHSPLQRQVTPLEERHRIGSLQAALVLFKACTGPGMLFLPAAVKNAGLLSALIMTPIVGAMTLWCMLLLLDAAHLARQQGKSIADFADVGEAACGPFGRLLVNAAIVTSQLGCCTAYCVFVAENVQSVIFESYGGAVGQPGSGDKPNPCGLPGLFADKFLVYYIILLSMPLLIPFTWVRQIRYFACSNFVASCLVLLSLGYMLTSFAFSLSAGGGAHAHGLTWFNPAGSLVYFGTAVYAFEGACVLLPTERCMRRSDGSQSQSEARAVVCWTVTVLCCCQLLFAVVAYVLYGENTKSVITVSLSDSSAPALGGTTGVISVQLAWIVEVFLTFPLQLFLPARILEPAFFRRGAYQRRHSGRKWTKNAICTSLLVLCMAVSLVGYSSVENLVSVIGALGCVPLAIVYPAFFHWRIAYSGGGASAGTADASNGQTQAEPQALLTLASSLSSSHSQDLEPRVQPQSQSCLECSRQSASTIATVSATATVTATTSNDGTQHWMGTPLGSAASDLLIGGVGAAGVLLTTVMAVRAWVLSGFEFQTCVVHA